MNRKHNPFLSLAALLLLALILVLVCTACLPTETAAADNNDNMLDRFKVERAGRAFPWLAGLYVITDTQTGVQYLYAENTTGAGLVKLEG